MNFHLTYLLLALGSACLAIPPGVFTPLFTPFSGTHDGNDILIVNRAVAEFVPGKCSVLILQNPAFLPIAFNSQLTFLNLATV